MNSKVQFVDITESQEGQRIDNFLIKTLKNLPRSRLYRIIRKGEVRVNKKRIKPEYKLCIGDRVRIPPVKLEPTDDTPVVIPQDLLVKVNDAILFENKSIIILNKPSGLAVHSGSGLRYGAIDVLRELRNSDIELVHRLDRDTSGCLLFAKTRQGLLAMQNLFKSQKLTKTYLAIVKGHWDRSVKDIQLPLLKQTMSNGERKVFVDERGQQAHTKIKEVTLFSKNGVDYSLLKIRLLTGRTHQIRVHCKSQNHEIGGDQKYGDRLFDKLIKKISGSRLLLHAAELEIPENDHTKSLLIKAPEPWEFKKLKQNPHH
ncbi:MAG: RluA family pseudouridine synthase [Gammaproteobacteria bacterium]|jgi:23S rRNA pseudouridine955/2504/2580 synthase|nr:RluA family pseudouridine synthase [Gammaproteobacteria bacterium]MBT3722186.1 RluA family pseudouridine synthase [Gammaproteobacteria bacterium]MBT4078004.1 RluA family pseudouridine synthase [Gammaproteobacteria bacterium]MBT4193503.1 RluA family pseudouridine synthase [Gammaproteobacteria bacterium]MBT4452164.1 RluA family pseudouridine synthase [Gammaproteobacteria bacterium]